MGGFTVFKRFKIKICYFFSCEASPARKMFLLLSLYYLLYLDTLDNYNVHNTQF